MVQQAPGGMGTPPPGMPPPQPPGMFPQGPPRRGVALSSTRLPLADMVVAGAGLLALIWSRLDWYKYVERSEWFGEEEIVFSATGKGGLQWGSFIFLLLLFLFACFVIANHFLNFVQLPIPVGLVYLGMAGLSMLFVLLGLAVKPQLSIFGIGTGEKMGMNWVMWVLMLIFNAGVVAGGVMKVVETQ